MTVRDSTKASNHKEKSVKNTRNPMPAESPAGFVGPVLAMSCTTCGEHKLMFDFSRHTASKFRRNPVCLPCNSKKSTEYFRANKTAVAEKARAYRQEHREDLKISKAEYFQRNKVEIVGKQRQRALANPEATHQFWADFYARHKPRLQAEAKLKRARPEYKVWALGKNRAARHADPEKARTYHAAYYESNKDEIKAVRESWRTKNPATVKYLRWRRSLHIGAGGFISWKNFRALSRKAAAISEMTGTKMVLDHAYPLVGARVSGLNTPANLHIVSEDFNQRKANKMPGWLSHEHFATDPWEVFHG